MWTEISAKDFCSSVRDGTHDSPKPVDSGRYLVTSRHIIGGMVDLSNAYLISDEDFEAINKRSKVDKWDVLISMIGTVGEPCLVKDDPEFAIKNIGLFKTKNELDGRWLYYYLRSPQSQELIRQYSRGTTQSYIPLGALRDFPIRLPVSREVMFLITNMLRKLDDKIDLNRQINQTLEAMAQAIFKSWFVDFDPVKAKIAAIEAGKDPLRAAMSAISGKSDTELDTMPRPQYEELAATAALFPEELVESELGDVPKGWEVPSFDSLVSAKQGKYLGKQDMQSLPNEDFNIPVWGGNGVLGFSKKSSYDAPIVLMTCRGSNCGLIKYTESKAWVSNNSFACEPKIGSTFYLLNYFWMENFADCISGSAQPQITYAALKTKKMKFPTNAQICDRFSCLLDSTFLKILSNNTEIVFLAELRDTLLPKLLSGELSVSSLSDLTESMAAI